MKQKIYYSTLQVMVALWEGTVTTTLLFAAPQRRMHAFLASPWSPLRPRSPIKHAIFDGSSFSTAAMPPPPLAHFKQKDQQDLGSIRHLMPLRRRQKRWEGGPHCSAPRGKPLLLRLPKTRVALCSPKHCCRYSLRGMNAERISTTSRFVML